MNLVWVSFEYEEYTSPLHCLIDDPRRAELDGPLGTNKALSSAYKLGKMRHNETHRIRKYSPCGIFPSPLPSNVDYAIRRDRALLHNLL